MTLTARDYARILGMPECYPAKEKKMSVLSCDDCGQFIDTDEQPETYHEEINRGLCESCWDEYQEAYAADRERLIQPLMAALAETGKGVDP